MTSISDGFNTALPSILLSSIVPPAAACLWNLRNKRHTEELRAIDICTRKISFLNEWIKAQSVCDPQRFGDVRGQVADELQGLKDELAKQLLEARQLREERNINMAKSSLFKSLFLAYTPLGWFTWLLHMVYWYILVVLVFLGFANMINRDPKEALSLLVGAIPLLMPINLLARWSQRRSECVREKAAKKSVEIIKGSAHVGIS